MGTNYSRGADIEKRAREMREVLAKALERWEYCGTEYRKILGEAGLVSHFISKWDDYEYYECVVSDDYYDGEAIAFALKVVDKILGQGETDGD